MPGVDPISAGLDLAASFKPGDLILNLLNPTLRKQIIDENNLAKKDVQDFCSAALRGDLDTCDLMLNGLRSEGALPDLASDQCAYLDNTRVSVSLGTVCHAYVVARQGNNAARVSEILNIAAQEQKKS